MDEGNPEYELHSAQARAHILGAVLKAIDHFDIVTDLVRSCDSIAAARIALMDQMGLDEVQARAVTDMQVLQLARRQLLADEFAEAKARVAELESKPATD